MVGAVKEGVTIGRIYSHFLSARDTLGSYFVKPHSSDLKGPIFTLLSDLFYLFLNVAHFFLRQPFSLQPSATIIGVRFLLKLFYVSLVCKRTKT